MRASVYALPTQCAPVDKHGATCLAFHEWTVFTVFEHAVSVFVGVELITVARHDFHVGANTNAADACDQVPHGKCWMSCICANKKPITQSAPLRCVVTKSMLQSELCCCFLVWQLKRLAMLGGFARRMQLAEPYRLVRGAQHLVFESVYDVFLSLLYTCL